MNRYPSRVTLVVFITALGAVSLACARGDTLLTQEPRPPALQRITAVPTETLPPVIATTAAPTAPDWTPTPARPKPLVSPTLPPTPTMDVEVNPENILYESQPGDTLRTLSVRFGVLPEDIDSTSAPLPEENALIDPGLVLIIPHRFRTTGPDEKLIPDSEVVYSPHAADFDVAEYMANFGGYLNSYSEEIHGLDYSGPQVVERAALAHSVNPRLLLALLEYYTGWVTDPTVPVGEDFTYPLGVVDEAYMGLYRQLTWLSNELGQGYYSWRAGTLIDLPLVDSTKVRLAPTLNAGTVALQYVFSLNSTSTQWEESLDQGGFIAVYKALFGDPWEYMHPLYEPALIQPPLILPFLPAHIWSFTGGPHGAWEREAAWAALDFAPSITESGCAISDEWIVASAPGLVTRSDDGLVVIDLDGDNLEQTGWVILYLHVAKRHRVKEGEFLEQGDLIGHPSCEGGYATGTHVHIVRKYNGEWVLADGPLPFEMSGWVAQAGTLPYEGALVKGDEIVLACPCSSQETLIRR